MSDLLTIGPFLQFLFPIALLSVSMYVSRTEVTAESYFFANRNTHWLVLGGSFVTTCIFSPYFFGLTASGSASGLPLIYGLISVIMVVVLGWFVAPVYLKMKISTLPEYFERRFDRSCRYFLSSLYIVSNIVIRLMIILVAGNVLLKMISGTDAYSSLLFLLVITGIYVIIGGVVSELYVNIVQVFLIILSVVAFSGWFIVRSDGIHLLVTSLTSFEASGEFTWTGIAFGLPILGFWFWCADQFIVQRVVSVRAISDVRKAAVITGILQVLPILIFLLPGLVAGGLLKSELSGGTVGTMFTGGLVAQSLRGGLIIGVTAALMGSFANLFNSTSLLVTFDFYRSFNPAASGRKLVLVGRLTTMILLFLAILITPISQGMNFDSCLKLLKIFAYVSAMVTAVLVSGMLNDKVDASSAFATLSVGTVIVLFRAILEIFFTDQDLGNVILTWFATSGFLEFSILIFVFNIVFLFVFHQFNLGTLFSSLVSKFDAGSARKAKE